MDNFRRKITPKRREQISKIKRYAEEYLGIDVEFLTQKELGTDAGGYLAPEGNNRGKISISNDYSGLITIFILLHEIGHHIDFLKRGFVDDEEHAYHFYPEKRGQSCPLKYQKKIIYVEDQAIKYAYELAVYLDLKLPAFQFVKDELYTIKSTKLTLQKGVMNKKEVRALKRECHSQARKLLNSKYKGAKTLPLPGR